MAAVMEVTTELEVGDIFLAPAPVVGSARAPVFRAVRCDGKLPATAYLSSPPPPPLLDYHRRGSQRPWEMRERFARHR
jgi:hypothetical protein